MVLQCLPFLRIAKKLIINIVSKEQKIIANFINVELFKQVHVVTLKTRLPDTENFYAYVI